MDETSEMSGSMASIRPETAEEYEKRRWGPLCAAFEDSTIVNHLSVASVAAMTGTAIRDRDVALGLAAQAARRSQDPNAWLNLVSILADCGPEWYVPFYTAWGEATSILEVESRHGIDPDRLREARATLNHNRSVMDMKAGYLLSALKHALMATAMMPQRAVFWFQLGNVYARMDTAWVQSDGGQWAMEAAITAYKTCCNWCELDSGSVNPDHQRIKDWGDAGGNTRTGLKIMALNCIRSVHQIHGRAEGMDPNPNRWRNYEYNHLTNGLAVQNVSAVKLDGVTKIGIYMEQGLGDQIESLPHIERLLTVLSKQCADSGQTLDAVICAPQSNHRLILEALSPFSPRVSTINSCQGIGGRTWIGSLDVGPRLRLMTGRKWGTACGVLKASISSYSRRFNNDMVFAIERSTGPKIGLCWRGSPGHPGDWARSVKDNLVGNIFQDKVQSSRHQQAISYYSLQKPYTPGQITVPDNVTDLAPYISDSLDLAKFVSMMDAVVTVDTVVLHLCAVLGVRCFSAMPYHPDSRWGLPPSNIVRSDIGQLSIIWQSRPNPHPKSPLGNWAINSMAYAWESALNDALVHVRGLSDSPVQEKL